MQTNYNGKDLIQIVGSVYDCIADEALWPETLDQIRQVCDGYLATLGVIDVKTNHTRFSVAVGDKDALKPIDNLPASDYPFLPAVLNMALDVPFRMKTIYSNQSPKAREDLESSSLFREWVVPNNIADFIWVPMVKTLERTGNLVVITDKSRARVSEADLEMMGQLAPHVRRAVSIGDLFETERGKGEVFREVVEALQTPVFIVSEDMQILFANMSAENILKEKLVVASRNGALNFSYRHAENAIQRAVFTSTKDEFILGPLGINVPLLRVETPAVAHVMPLARRDLPHRINQKAAAAIFIATSGSAPKSAMEAIGAIFGLTPAEKNIATHLASGRKTSEIATVTGVSENTVRTHIGHLFDKTGTSDQRDLVSLIRDLTPPIRTDQ